MLVKCGEKKDWKNEDYALKMRKLFSNKNSILQNGELNHKYFQTKLGQYWTHDDNENLLKGIEEVGVGAWKEIKASYLKNWVSTLMIYTPIKVSEIPAP